eukprot:CAMPEP_0114263904 /NCGR_PEP_ID=MMETSP0058-20121206/22843_1 /TAXON_ID=36894 /ORGANISM="Pyramimonas parkeae, CCMP726" /LENGTH=32 /DNA_ID= /DNA_START= /DNA_END= /DNA_ORIENTATION=
MATVEPMPTLSAPAHGEPEMQFTSWLATSLRA